MDHNDVTEITDDEGIDADGFRVTNMKKFLEEIDCIELNIISIDIADIANECLQYTIAGTFPLNFAFKLILMYPKGVTFKDLKQPTKLRILISDDEMKNELISCTNYLQRRKNIELAFSVLSKCALHTSERKLIFNTFLLHFKGAFTCRFHDDGSVYMACRNRATRFKFFETTWKVIFDCRTRSVMDMIDFNVSTRDSAFHGNVKPVMTALVEPNVPLTKKVDLWMTIINTMNMAIADKLTAKPSGDPDVEFINCREINERDILSISDDEYIVIE